MDRQPPDLCHEEKLALPYRPCVGALVVNKDGLVWLGRRMPNEEYDGDSRLWQFPQGGIDPGEEPEPAARRELYEETSISSVSLIGEVPGWLTYDLPDRLIGVALKGKYRGQKQRWFLYRFEGSDSDIDVSGAVTGHSAEFDAWMWIEIEKAPDLAVAFKVELYREIISALRGNPNLAWQTS